MYPPIKLNSKGFKKYLKGAQWFTEEDLYDPERVKREVEPGSTISLYAENSFLAQAFYNPYSRYVIKIVSHERRAINRDFFVETLSRALSFRNRIYPQEKAFRLVFAEGDFLPGLVVDIYDKVAVLQIHTLGMERLKETLVEALPLVYPLESILLKNDFEKRKEEGLPLYVESYLKEPPETVLVAMDDIKFLIPIKKGQKTGFFLDQRENRRFLGKISSNLTLIDAFSYTGAFSLYALKGGAKRAFLLDRSTYALELALETAKLNGFTDHLIPVEGDVFTLLKNPVATADILVLDPPALIKSKRDFEKGFQKYKELYFLGLNFFKEKEGLLLAFSCSHYLSLEEMRNIFLTLLNKLQKRARLFKIFHQAPDHPINPYVKETEYLKGIALQLV